MSKIRPKPDGVEIPEDKAWEELTSYQRHYYENREAEKSRTMKRKYELSDWLQSVKDDLSCKICGESRNPCLEFHHKNSENKNMAVSNMPRDGYSRETIMEEIEKCEILCANCHRVKHHNI